MHKCFSLVLLSPFVLSLSLIHFIQIKTKVVDGTISEKEKLNT